MSWMRSRFLLLGGNLAVIVAAGCTPRYGTHTKARCPAASDSSFLLTQPASRPAINGEMTDRDTGRPLAGGVVSLVSSATTASTDSLGRFQIRELEAGRLVVRSRRIGYEERVDTVTLRSGTAIRMHLALTPAYVDRCMEMQQVRTRSP